MNRKRPFLMFIVLFWALMTAFFTGCSEKNMTTQNKSDNYEKIAQVNLNPSPAKILQKNDLSIIPTKTNHTLLQHATVTITLSMPDMDHGKIEVAAQKTANGFLAKITPTMIGRWMADINIVKDGKTSTIQYEFQAVR